MLQEQNPQSDELDLRLIAIKDAFVAVGQSVIWSEVGMLTQSKDIIGSEHRLERSQYFGDDDYAGHALNVLKRIVDRDSRNELKLVQYALSKLDVHFMRNSPVHERLKKIADNLDTIQVIGADELPEHPHIAAHVNRIKGDVIDDPEAAIGSCKDLVESALKAILDTPDDKLKGYSIPKLIKAARGKLSRDLGGLEHDQDMLKMLNNFGQILDSIATVRNRHGTGHGRWPADTFNLPQPYVVLAANSAISMAVFLTQMRDLMNDGVVVGTPRESVGGAYDSAGSGGSAYDPAVAAAVRRNQQQQRQTPPTQGIDTSWYDSLKAGHDGDVKNQEPSTTDQVKEGEDLPW